jgi:hypothetical protein
MTSKVDTLTFDLAAPITILVRLFRNCEPCVFEDLRELVIHLPRELLAGFFGNFFKPAYVAVEGTTERIAELRFFFPRSADEMLAALRAYEADRRGRQDGVDTSLCWASTVTPGDARIAAVS